MCPDIQAPRPVRSLKRPLKAIDPDRVSANKHPRLSPALPVSFVGDQPKARGMFDGTLDHVRPNCAPTAKYYGLKSPPLTASVHSWRSSVARPDSAPPALQAFEISETLARNLKRPASLPPLDERSQHPQSKSESVSSGTSRPETSDPRYSAVLKWNGVYKDVSCTKLPDELRDFKNEKILKRRNSPQLNDAQVGEVVEAAESLQDRTENPVMKLLRTSMFPLDHGDGLNEGGNTRWCTDALPNNPNYMYSLAAPKPDFHLGYSTDPNCWTLPGANVLGHRVMLPYSQPTRDNAWPFLMMEMKAEAAGGTHWHAENQAAGSGSSAFNALSWLYKESSQTHTLANTVAFTLTGNHQSVNIYMHWRSDEDCRHYMSRIKHYECSIPQDIRDCNSTVKNIIDYAVGERKTQIGAALQALFPFPEHWQQYRKADDVIPDTPLTSFTSMGSKKRQRTS